MNKATKKILLNYVLAPIVLVVLLLLIYKQIINKGDISQQWQDLKTHLSPKNIYWFALIILLAPLNWTLEALKWQKLLVPIQKTSLHKAFISMMTGMAFSLITPNRTGDFAGRILYVAHKNKFKAAIASIIGSTAQLCITATLGTFGLIYYNIKYPKTIMLIALIAAVILAVVMLLVFVNIQKITTLNSRYRFLRRIKISLRVLKNYSKKELLIILLISLGRFLIYNLQFLLLIHVLGATVPFFEGLLLSSLMFWMIAVIPSIAMIEIGVRGFVGIFLFVESGITAYALPILSGSYLLWFINLVLPAVVGSFMILTIKKEVDNSKM